MSMTREDMLRELELLPVWQLRQPLPSVPVIAPEHVEQAVAPGVAVTVDQNVAVPEPAAEPVVAAVPEVQAVAEALPVRALSSEDGAYVFLLAPADALADAEAERLLQNMLRAMRVSSRVEVQDTVENIFSQHQPKLVICMGELPANLLLQQSFTLQDWRSRQPASFQEIPVIVTYAPQHLLSHIQDKVLAWKDLCLAMQLMQGL